MKIDEAADLLRRARESRRAMPPFTDKEPHLAEEWAYDVQALDQRERTARGEVVIGAKLGLTSGAKQQRMGVAQPIAGFLTSAMQLRDDQVGARHRHWLQPRIEPEIAFITAHTLDHELMDHELANAVDKVLLAAEVIDSRWIDYRFRLADVVADNTSAAGFILGSHRATLAEVGDLTALQCEVAVDDKVVHRATGDAILGAPLLALKWLSRHLERRGTAYPRASWCLPARSQMRSPSPPDTTTG